MDALRRTYEQFVRLFRAMTPSQRAVFVAVPLLLAAGFGFLMFGRGSSSYVPLSWGKVFTLEERIRAEQTLNEAGLTDFHTKGQLIMVPRDEVDRYNAALMRNGALPANALEEWEAKLEQNSLFASTRQLEQMKEIGRAKLIREMIRPIPEIEDVQVFWARGTSRPGLGGGRPRVTATASVRPRAGYELSMDLVRSLRSAVANMVPDLREEDVVILDQRTGKSYTVETDDPLGDGVLRRIREFEELYRRRITQALDFIPNVLVSVNVDLENLRRSIRRMQTLESKSPVELVSETRSRTETSSRKPTAVEPGVRPNSGRELAASAGPEETSNRTESDAKTVSVPAKSTITEDELAGLMPKAVQVNVSIPRDYYRSVAIKNGLSEGTTDEERAKFNAELQKIEQEVVSEIEQIVARNIPADSPQGAYHVGSYTRVDLEEPEIEIPLTTTIGHTLTQWGSAIGLAVFALWALWMLNRSLRTLSVSEEEEDEALPAQASVEAASEQTEEEPRETNPRDQLQAVVRDNPELAAAVLRRWIQSAR